MIYEKKKIQKSWFQRKIEVPQSKKIEKIWSIKRRTENVVNCVNPVRILKNIDRREYPDGLLVPCGKCLNCRVQKRTEWTLRLYHENSMWEDSVFVTLTYDNNNIEYNDIFQPILVKRDLQLFLKRLRKNLGKKKIKYFACGEYGKETGRPHYHLIIFGLSTREEDINVIKDSWKKCDWNCLDDKKSFGTVEKDSIQYVCKYIHSKLSGDELYKKYYELGLPNVFRLTSMGHGRKFVEKYADNILENKTIRFKGCNKSLPRYYVKILDTDITELKHYAEDKERDFTYKILGVHHTRDEIYKCAKNDDILKLEEANAQKNKQKERNLKAKIRIKSQKL